MTLKNRSRHIHRADPAADELHQLSTRTLDLMAKESRGTLTRREAAELEVRLAEELARNTLGKAEAYERHHAGDDPSWSVPEVPGRAIVSTMQVSDDDAGYRE